MALIFSSMVGVCMSCYENANASAENDDAILSQETLPLRSGSAPMSPQTISDDDGVSLGASGSGWYDPAPGSGAAGSGGSGTSAKGKIKPTKKKPAAKNFSPKLKLKKKPSSGPM